jgi:hypothetical protein
MVLPIRASQPVNPVLVKHADQRAEDEQLHDAAGAGGARSHGSERTVQAAKEDVA